MEQNAKESLISGNIMTKPAKDTVAAIKEMIETGVVEPSYVGVALKKFAKLTELVKKDKPLQEIINDDVLRYQEGTAKTFYVHGAKITAAERGYWDYTNTNDPVLKALKEIEKDVKAFIKERETILQTLAASWDRTNKPTNVVEFGLKPFNITWDSIPQLVWEESVGEIQTNPPVKGSQTQLRFSL